MSTFSVSITPGYLLQDGELLTPDICRAIAQPTVNLTGAFSTASIADSSITPAKIATSVAGDGLTGGAGTALSVVTDGTTLGINGSNQLYLLNNAIELKHLKVGSFTAGSNYAAGITGLVPSVPAGSQANFLRGDGTWADAVGLGVAASTAALTATTQFQVYKAFTFL